MSAQFPFHKALITGAGGELGTEVCKELASRGVSLVLTDRSSEMLEPVAVQCQASVAVSSLPVDLTDLEGFESVLKRILVEHSDIDLVVAVAGVDFYEPIESYDWRKAKWLIDINLMANYVLLTTFVPYFLKRGSGHVTAVCSLGGFLGCPYEHAYNSSKAGLRMLMDGLRAECRGRGVTFTTVFPGYLTGTMASSNGFKVNKTISMNVAAQKIVAGTGRKKPILKFPWLTWAQIAFSDFLPTAIRDVMVGANSDPKQH